MPLIAITRGDAESQNANGFENPKVRAAFVRKVYFLLSLQLITTFGIVLLFALFDEPREYIQANIYIFYVAIGVVLFSVIVLACCESIRRTSPINYIVFVLLTLAMGCTLGVISSINDPEMVIISVAITMLVCIMLTIFAFQTKWDFTGYGVLFLVILIILISFGIISFFIRNRTIHLIYCCAGVFVFSFYLIYDTQLMMGHQHKYAINPDEYVFAALNLYIDVINLFIYVLSLLHIIES